MDGERHGAGARRRHRRQRAHRARRSRSRRAPALIGAARNREAAAKVAKMMGDNGHFSLPFAISMAKALTLAAADIADSPIVTTMSGNGREFGIRVSGLGDRWFLAPSPIGEPKLIAGAR